MDLTTMILACSLYTNDSTINAMVNVGTQNNPLVVSGKTFNTMPQALAYADHLQEQGSDFTIGLLQIPSRWLHHQSVSLSELLRPCKNMVIATQILNQLQSSCGNDESCVLSTYQSGDAQSGLPYANQIIQYANDHPFTPPPSTE